MIRKVPVETEQRPTQTEKEQKQLQSCDASCFLTHSDDDDDDDDLNYIQSIITVKRHRSLSTPACRWQMSQQRSPQTQDFHDKQRRAAKEAKKEDDRTVDTDFLNFPLP